MCQGQRRSPHRLYFQARQHTHSCWHGTTSNHYTFPFVLKACGTAGTFKKGEVIHGQVVKWIRLGLVCGSRDISTCLLAHVQPPHGHSNTHITGKARHWTFSIWVDISRHGNTVEMGFMTLACKASRMKKLAR
ncbi:hypothetical protein Fmac_024235 [Flemingia macrophylla]|uniref:Uncharacterized protein n=1 Tax=Flemingia macrophylla TaxID=520843 RepID=A0ABD1LNU0_9FABA